MKIITLGTVALDTIRTPFGLRKDILGGSAVHFSLAARFFADINLVSVIGVDFPQRHLDFLKKKGIDASSITKIPGKSFRWSGEYKGDLNEAITLNTQLGVLNSFSPKIAKSQKKIRNVFLANVDPDIQMQLLKSIDHPKLVALDTMNFWISNKKKSLLRILKKADIFLVNEKESRQLSEQTYLINAAKSIRKLGPKIILIKKGEHGVIAYFDGSVITLPAFPVDKVIDPTGAGDSFAGGFMGFLSTQKKINKDTLKKAIVYGIIIASFNVESFGPQGTARLSLKEINDRLRVYKKLIHF